MLRWFLKVDPHGSFDGTGGGASGDTTTTGVGAWSARAGAAPAARSIPKAARVPARVGRLMGPVVSRIARRQSTRNDANRDERARVLPFLETFTLTFALALFLGGGAYWAFVAAPAVFAVSPGPKVAGQLAAAMSGRFDRIAQACLFAIGGIELLRITERATPTEVLRATLAGTMTALTLYTLWAVRPELR